MKPIILSILCLSLTLFVGCSKQSEIFNVTVRYIPEDKQAEALEMAAALWLNNPTPYETDIAPILKAVWTTAETRQTLINMSHTSAMQAKFIQRVLAHPNATYSSSLLNRFTSLAAEITQLPRAITPVTSAATPASPPPDLSLEAPDPLKPAK